MTPALALILTASLTLGAEPDGPLLRRGADPARGLLVNRAVGLRPFDPPDPALPTVVFVHGFNPAPRIVHFEMAARLGEALARRGARCNVLDWDWNAATADSPSFRANAHDAVAQGRLLAAAIARAGVDPGRTHLIGHSSGAMVATSAAHEFATRHGRPVAQLTLLEAATFYHALIFQELHAGSLAPVVENYWTAGPSAWGKAVNLPGVRSYHVDGRAQYWGVVRPARSDHVSIVAWYVRTVEEPASGIGFNTNGWIAPR